MIKAFHKHDDKIICAQGVEVSFPGVSTTRIDTKVDLLCKKCGDVRTKTFIGQELSPGHIEEIAEIKGWEFDVSVFK